MVPVLAAATLVDVRELRIPNTVNRVGGALALLLGSLGLGQPPLSAVLWAVVIAGPLIVISSLAPGGWGMGDSKLTAVIALFIGPLSLHALVIACLGGVLVGFTRQKFRSEGMPFAPFLSAGALAAVVIG